MSRRTAASMNEWQHNAAFYRYPGWQPTHHMEPAEAGEYLFVTSAAGCLTHLIRWVGDTPEQRIETKTRPIIPARRSYEALCGVLSSDIHGAIVVDPKDETFGCHACIAKAEKWGLPTHNLIPSTGCEATDGQRFRRKATT